MLPLSCVVKEVLNVYIVLFFFQIILRTFAVETKEAFQAYKREKEKLIKERATQYFQEGKITQRVYQALMEYQVEITD